MAIGAALRGFLVGVVCGLVPHFGIHLNQEDFDAVKDRIAAAGLTYIDDPYRRFEGDKYEQETFFIADPNNNVLEIKTMKKTLTQLRERNTSFRSSFAKADMNGTKAQELRILENKAQSAEDDLFRVRKELQVLEKTITEDKSELDDLMKQVACNEKKNISLKVAKEKFLGDVVAAKNELDQYSKKVVSSQSEDSHHSRRELQYRKFHAELVSLQADRISKLLVNLANEFPQLSDDIKSDMKRVGLL